MDDEITGLDMSDNQLGVEMKMGQGSMRSTVLDLDGIDERPFGEH